MVITIFSLTFWKVFNIWKVCASNRAGRYHQPLVTELDSSQAISWAHFSQFMSCTTSAIHVVPLNVCNVFPSANRRITEAWFSIPNTVHFALMHFDSWNHFLSLRIYLHFGFRVCIPVLLPFCDCGLKWQPLRGTTSCREGLYLTAGLQINKKIGTWTEFEASDLEFKRICNEASFQHESFVHV